MTARPILVAGRSGQLARCLVESAAQRGIPLVAIGRPELDVEDARSIEHAARAVEPSAMVNAAAYTAVDRAESEPGASFRGQSRWGGAASLWKRKGWACH